MNTYGTTTTYLLVSTYVPPLGYHAKSYISPLI